MRRFWPYIYLVGAIACVFVGSLRPIYKSLVYQATNWKSVAETFLVFFVYPIAIVALRRVFRGNDSLLRPSQFVNPTNSPLQLIRVMLVGFSAICVGRIVSLLHATPEIFMVFWANVGAVLGLSLAEQIIYKVWAKKITP